MSTSSSHVVFITGGLDRKIRFWEPPTGICLKTLRAPDTHINSLLISPKKTHVLAGGNPHIFHYDVRGTEGNPTNTFKGHSSNVTSLIMDSGGDLLFSGSEDGTIKIWDVRTPSQPQISFERGSPVNQIALHPNHTEVVCADQGGAISFWDLRGETCTKDITPGGDVSMQTLTISPDGGMIVGGNMHAQVFAWSLPSFSSSDMEDLVSFQAHEEYLLKAVLSPNLRCLATCSADSTCKLWDTESWDLLHTFDNHQRWVWDATFSADGLLIASCSSDTSAKLWSTENGELVKNYTGHSLAVTCIALDDS